MSQTVFRRLCKERQWGRPEVFLKVYAKVAAGLGEPEQVTARQFHRWRQPAPPCPGPSRQRVLEEMFGMPLEQLGFAVPLHRVRPLPEPGCPLQGQASTALRMKRDHATAPTPGTRPVVFPDSTGVSSRNNY